MSAELATQRGATGPDRLRRSASVRILRPAAGAAAGVAAWCSFGVLALSASSGEAVPVGLLPPLWVAGVFAALGAGAAIALPSIPTGLLVLPCLTILPWFLAGWPTACVWSGPLVAIPWALVAASGLPAFTTRGAPAVMLLAALSLTMFAVSIAPSGVGGDQPHYLMIAGSLLEDGDLDLKNDYDDGREALVWGFYSGGFTRRQVSPGLLGRQYSAHPPGLAFLVLPGFAWAGVNGARAILIAVSVLGLGALWRAARDLTGSAGAAWAAVAALLCQLPFAAQASSIYPDGPAAAIVCFALLTLTRIERGATVSTWALLATGAALALLPWLHPRLLLVAGLFGGAMLIALWARQRRVRPLAVLMAVPIVSGIASIAASLVMFGLIDPTAPYRPPRTSFAGTPAGVAGLLIDHEYGLLPYAPALAFALAGFGRLRRSAALTAWSSLLAAAGTLLVAASFIWWGGNSAPARYLVAILPVLALWLAVFWTAASRVTRAACAASIVVGGTLAALAAWADRGFYVTTDPDGRYSIFEWANTLVRVADALPSLFRDGARFPIELGIALFWGTSALLLMLLASALSRVIERHADWRTISAWLIVGWISVGTTVAWAVRGVDPRSPDRSQVALLQAAAGSGLTTGYRYGHLTSSRDDVLMSLRLASPSESDELTRLHVPRVPAGRYQIEVAGSRPVEDAETRLTLYVGRDPWPLSVWPLSAPDRAPAITLVAPVHSLRVETSQPVDARTQILLRPLGQLTAPSIDAHVVAQHVVRYGDLLVYLIEASRFVESGRFSLRGEQRANVIIARDDGTSPAVMLTLSAAASPVSVTVSRGAWQESVAVPAASDASLLIPASDRPALLVMDVSGGDRARPAVSVFPRVAP